MTNNKKIIDKICKCLRLSESANPNEAELALRQATALMKKYGVSNTQVLAAEVAESTVEAGERYNPPFWALALANLVAEAFQCRNLISRQYGRNPEFRFIGLGYKAEVATYSYTVLYRNMLHAIEEFEGSLQASTRNNESERLHRIEVFAQAWLFRIGRTVKDFLEDHKERVIIDDYIQEKYGETVEMSAQSTETKIADYDDILSGMRAAHGVGLYRSVGQFAAPSLIHHKQAS